MDRHHGLTPPLAWAVAGQAIPGQAQSGDAFAVVPSPSGTSVLVAVVDGLGHGQEAATASRLAVATLQEHPGAAVEELMEHCHRALLKTRGAVLSLASFSATGQLSWMGVGNVEGVLVPADPERPRQTVLLRGGVVGFKLPPLRASLLPVARGDTLVFATDGIRGGLTGAGSLLRGGDIQELAEDILCRQGSGADDALVLVARYLGPEMDRTP